MSSTGSQDMSEVSMQLSDVNHQPTDSLSEILAAEGQKAAMFTNSRIDPAASHTAGSSDRCVSAPVEGTCWLLGGLIRRSREGLLRWTFSGSSCWELWESSSLSPLINSVLSPFSSFLVSQRDVRVRGFQQPTAKRRPDVHLAQLLSLFYPGVLQPGLARHPLHVEQQPGSVPGVGEQHFQSRATAAPGLL